MKSNNRRNRSQNRDCDSKKGCGKIVRPIFKGQDCAKGHYYFLGESRHMLLLQPADYDEDTDCFYVSYIVEGYPIDRIECLLWHNKNAKIKREDING